MILSEKPRIEFLRMDCIELMRNTPDRFYDLAIVDPPYGIGADMKNSCKKLQSKKSAYLSKNYGSQVWDNDIPDELFFNELNRVSKKQII